MAQPKWPYQASTDAGLGFGGKQQQNILELTSKLHLDMIIQAELAKSGICCTFFKDKSLPQVFVTKTVSDLKLSPRTFLWLLLLLLFLNSTIIQEEL